MIQLAPRVTVDQNVCSGKPVIAGTRVPVSLVIGQLAAGETSQTIQFEYGLTAEDVLAALAYAAKVLSDSEPSPRDDTVE